MRRTISVFCSSSNAIAEEYVKATVELADELAKRHYTLVYGGTSLGLMGTLARRMLEKGGRVIGVIPRFLQERGIAFEGLSELIVTDSLRERKEKMDQLSEGCIALPGGIGTLEELFEMLALKQLKQHNKPVVLYDISGFFHPLLAYIERMIEQRFLKPDFKHLFYLASHARHAIHYFDTYRPVETEEKWVG